MVAYGHVQPVGQQWIVGISKHLAHIGGVFDARIKVGIVSYAQGHTYLHFIYGCKDHFKDTLRKPTFEDFALYCLAQWGSDCLAKGYKIIEVLIDEYFLRYVGKFFKAMMWMKLRTSMT